MTTSENHQSVSNHSKKQTPKTITTPLQPVQSNLEMEMAYLAASGRDMSSQVTLLQRVSKTQSHEIISRLGQVHGNRYVQRLVNSMQPAPASVDETPTLNVDTPGQLDTPQEATLTEAPPEADAPVTDNLTPEMTNDQAAPAAPQPKPATGVMPSPEIKPEPLLPATETTLPQFDEPTLSTAPPLGEMPDTQLDHLTPNFAEDQSPSADPLDSLTETPLTDLLEAITTLERDLPGLQAEAQATGLEALPAQVDAPLGCQIWQITQIS